MNAQNKESIVWVKKRKRQTDWGGNEHKTENRSTIDTSSSVLRLGLGAVISRTILEYSADEMMLGRLARSLSPDKLTKLLKGIRERRLEQVIESEMQRGRIQPWGKLVATHGFKSIVYLCEDEITLGRHVSCSLPVSRPEISGFHCQILKAPDNNEFILRDISKNGTIVVMSDSECSNAREIALKNRDISIDHGSEIILAMPRAPPDDEKISFIFTKFAAVNAISKRTSSSTMSSSSMTVKQPISENFCSLFSQTYPERLLSPIFALEQEYSLSYPLIPPSPTSDQHDDHCSPRKRFKNPESTPIV
mmetsp:Transcript_4536/g.6029  ORF Transcript_4536/g.6029 Transcript_4536/m.6029 type:complete len:306 (-) Transcript_4536:179-1096(-)